MRNSAVHHLDESNCGQQDNVRSGDTLIVCLQGTGGSGYQWEQAEVDPSVLRPARAPVEGDGGPGAPETYIFTFDAAGPGRTTLLLVYHRPSEGDAPPAKECRVTVTVR